MVINPAEYPDLLDLKSEREAEVKDDSEGLGLVTRRMESPLILVGQDEELGGFEVSIRHTGEAAGGQTN